MAPHIVISAAVATGAAFVGLLVGAWDGSGVHGANGGHDEENPPAGVEAVDGGAGAAGVPAAGGAAAHAASAAADAAGAGGAAADAGGAAADAGSGDEGRTCCLSSWTENACLFFRTIAPFVGFVYIAFFIALFSLAGGR